MKRILHLSDLHFGRTHLPALHSLQQFLKAQDNKIDLIIVTGDWTQRAKTKEFKAANEFIESLKTPLLSVPGNHDIPLYNLARRFLFPLTRYDRYIKSQTVETYTDAELAVIGLTTAHRSRMVEGILSKTDLDRVEIFFKEAAPTALKIVASHHPLVDDDGSPEIRPRSRLESLFRMKPNLILSGHLHLQDVQMMTLPSG